LGQSNAISQRQQAVLRILSPDNAKRSSD
jgi:hypothetical protein